jgi:VanZ family protein
MAKSDTYYFSIKWLIVALISTATVIFLTHLPREIIPSQLEERGLDKLEHIVAYGALTFLFIVSIRISHILFPALILLTGILLLAAVDEITQPLVNRTASLIDWAADAIGIATISLLFIYSKNAKPQVPPKADVSTQNTDS